MKKNITKILLTVLLSVFIQIVNAQTVSQDANLRSAPGTDASIVQVIPKGASLKIIERTNDKWVKVEYNGKKGYVSTSVINEKKESSSSSSNNNSKSNDDNSNSSSSKKSKRKSESSSSSNGSSNNGLGIGIRLGYPTGLSAKKYFGKGAVEFVIGVMPYNYSGYDYGWYNKRFNKYYKNYNGERIDWGTMKYNSSTAFGINFTGQKQTSQIKELSIYFGVGALVLLNSYKYGYWDRNGWYYWRDETYTDLGINVMVGAEYKFSDLPFTAFVDLGIYGEMFHYTGYMSPTGGVGFRYNID